MTSVALPLSTNVVTLIVKGHQICQASFALSEATLAVTNHLIFHVPWHSFQEDLLYDLARHRGETDGPVVPRVFPFTVFKNGVMFLLSSHWELHWTAMTPQI